MICFYRLLVAVALAAFFMGAAHAQNSGTVTNHAIPIGKGPGVQGFASLICGNTAIPIGQTSADPICAALSGDVTMSALGVTAIGASKVANSQLATMAANTSKCNATAGTANPTDCTAATMRTNLGLVIGTNVEAWDTDLDCLAALSSTGVISRTGSGTCSAGALAISGLATGTQDTIIGYWGSTTATAIAINNCTGALTYSTSTHTFGCNSAAGTGTVTSVTCGTGLSGGTFTTTGTCALALTNATTQKSPADPTGTTSVSAVMMGIGKDQAGSGANPCTITPVYSGRVEVWITASSQNNTSAAVNSFNALFGTGTAPSNGAAGTGTQIGPQRQSSQSGTVLLMPFQVGGIVTGLTTGTAYWFDLSLATSAGTASAKSVGCTIREF